MKFFNQDKQPVEVTKIKGVDRFLIEIKYSTNKKETEELQGIDKD